MPPSQPPLACSILSAPHVDLTVFFLCALPSLSCSLPSLLDLLLPPPFDHLALSWFLSRRAAPEPGQLHPQPLLYLIADAHHLFLVSQPANDAQSAYWAPLSHVSRPPPCDHLALSGFLSRRAAPEPGQLHPQPLLHLIAGARHLFVVSQAADNAQSA